MFSLAVSSENGVTRHHRRESIIVVFSLVGACVLGHFFHPFMLSVVVIHLSVAAGRRVFR